MSDEVKTQRYTLRYYNPADFVIALNSDVKSTERVVTLVMGENVVYALIEDISETYFSASELADRKLTPLEKLSIANKKNTKTKNNA